MESMALGGMYTHFRRCAGILSEKYREKMSKTFVCRFPKLDKRVVTWFSFGSLQLSPVPLFCYCGILPPCLLAFSRTLAMVCLLFSNNEPDISLCAKCGIIGLCLQRAV